MILLVKVVQLLLLFFVVRGVLSLLSSKPDRKAEKEKKQKRYDTRGKSVSDADFEEVE